MALMDNFVVVSSSTSATKQSSTVTGSRCGTDG